VHPVERLLKHTSPPLLEPLSWPLTTIAVRWVRIIAGSRGDLEESALDIVVGPGHATILSTLAFALLD